MNLCGFLASPFDLQMIQLPLRPPAAPHSSVQTPLHHVQHLGRSLHPGIHRALDVVLLQLVLVAVVRIDHDLPVGIPPEQHVGPEDAAQLAQEGGGRVQELLRTDVDHQDQASHGQLLWEVLGAVEAVPLTLGVVAALVAVVVGVVIPAVLVVQRAAGGGHRRLMQVSLWNIRFLKKDFLLALSFQVLAVETIVEAARVVTLRIALPVVEVAPTLQRGGAVLPGVIKVERAVAVVPAALVVVADRVAVLVVLVRLALRDAAGGRHLGQRRHAAADAPREAVVQDVAEKPVELERADAAVVRRLGGLFARPAVVARVGVAGAVGGMPALGSSEGRRAQAFGTLVTRNAGPSITTAEATTGLGVILTGGAGKTLQNKRRGVDRI